MRKPGEEIQIENVIEAMALVQFHKVRPILPEVAIYVALQAFFLPGKVMKHEAKKLELVELRAEDALPLLLQRIILPRDDSVWRPLNRRLRKGPDRSVAERAKREKVALDDKLFKIGIHPSQTKK